MYENIILRWHPEVGKVAGPDLTSIRSNIDNKNVSYKPNSARFVHGHLYFDDAVTDRDRYLLQLLLEFKSLFIHFRQGENFNDPFTNKVLKFQ